MINFLNGFKTYIIGGLTVAWGIYQITKGNVEQGINSISIGLAAVGLRSGVAASSAKTVK
jgi:hypothetical protein